MNSEVTLRDIRKLRVAQSYCDAKLVKSMDFHYNGEILVYSQNPIDGGVKTIVVLSLSDKIRRVKIRAEEFGAGICKFIDEEHIVHTSEKNDDSLRLLDIKHIHNVRYFPGHSKNVISVSVSGRHIISGSEDSTVHIFEVHMQQSLKRIKFPASTLVAFHPHGELFAVSYNTTIEIFTMKDFSESINKFQFEKVEGVDWKGLKFSNDGALLMVTTNSTSILIIDAIKGEELNNFRGEYWTEDDKKLERK
jgi:COMPASS component SWD2